MSERIEQSSKPGHYDAPSACPPDAVGEPTLPVSAPETPAPETPISSPPTLTLVGGTDLVPNVVDLHAGD